MTKLNENVDNKDNDNDNSLALIHLIYHMMIHQLMTIKMTSKMILVSTKYIHNTNMTNSRNNSMNNSKRMSSTTMHTPRGSTTMNISSAGTPSRILIMHRMTVRH